MGSVAGDSGGAVEAEGGTAAVVTEVAGVVGGGRTAGETVAAAPALVGPLTLLQAFYLPIYIEWALSQFFYQESTVPIYCCLTSSLLHPVVKEDPQFPMVICILLDDHCFSHLLIVMVCHLLVLLSLKRPVVCKTHVWNTYSCDWRNK